MWPIWHHEARIACCAVIGLSYEDLGALRSPAVCYHVTIILPDTPNSLHTQFSFSVPAIQTTVQCSCTSRLDVLSDLFHTVCQVWTANLCLQDARHVEVLFFCPSRLFIVLGWQDCSSTGAPSACATLVHLWCLLCAPEVAQTELVRM